MPARIVFKAHYLSSEKSTHIENYIQYMGTRPGVEIFEDDGSPATEKQKQLIEQMIEDFGKEMTESYEYEDYLSKPTKANASAAITACLDAEYGNTATKENYIDYIANRPRVEKLGEHGLFAQTDVPLDLDKIAYDVAHQGNNVWTNIISLHREDAVATGFDNAAAWRDLLRGKVDAIARNYKIPMRDFVWYAAFHDEGHHPHVHFVCYSKGNEGYLTEKGIENIKSSLAHEIFKQEFSEIYDRQTQLRTILKDESTQLMEQLARNISDNQYENTELREYIISLADRLDSLSGKKQYGYLPKDVKSLVDAITDELAGHETIATLYDRWYEQKEEILEIYKTKLPSRIPLSENKEFTSVKNMIIREVSGLALAQEKLDATIDLDDISSFDRVAFDPSGEGDSNIEQSQLMDDIQLFDDLDFDISFSDIEKDIQNLSDSDDIDVSDISDISSISDEIELSIPKKGVSHSIPRKSSVNPSLKLYWMGKQFLIEGEEFEAIECFKMSVEQGNEYAQYRLGKLYLNGTETVEKDIDQALYWLWKAETQYGYNIAVIDLRNPTRSDEINLLHLVNKYMDLALENPHDLSLRARAEKYAKIVSKTIMASDSESGSSKYGQNAYFYESAEGLITSTILLIAEFAPKETRHIISVFKLLQELLAPSGKKDKNKFQVLLESLPPEHKAKWFAGAALNSPQQQMMSVISTALSRLNAFLDSEMEQILCFDTAINAEKFCAEKSAIFIVMPEEDASKYFLVSLIVQQLYREILTIADEQGGQLNNRVMMYLDEFGTISKIENAEMMFSASRSRRISVVPIIQSHAQLEEKYGREGAKIIVDNCQLAMYCGFAPMSEDADEVSKRLGNQTVLSGSVSKGNTASQSLQMIERPLMTGDELRTMKKGSMLVTKTGTHPIMTKMKLFTKWGITFGEPYKLQDKSARPVKYVSEKDIVTAIMKKNHQEHNGTPKPKPTPFKPDPREAEKLLTQSAEQGNEYAAYKLGKLYLDGKDPIEQDTDKAAQYFQKAADKNNQYAQYQLAKLHLNGGEPQPKQLQKKSPLKKQSDNPLRVD